MKKEGRRQIQSRNPDFVSSRKVATLTADSRSASTIGENKSVNFKDLKLLRDSKRTFENDGRRLSAELQRDLLEVGLGRSLDQTTTGTAGAGESDLVDVHVLDDGL